MTSLNTITFTIMQLSGVIQPVLLRANAQLFGASASSTCTEDGVLYYSAVGTTWTKATKLTFVEVLQGVTLEEIRHTTRLRRVSTGLTWQGKCGEYLASCDICQRTNDSGKFVKPQLPFNPSK